MDKKELKWYVSPEEEVVSLETNVSLLAGSVTAEEGEWDDD